MSDHDTPRPGLLACLGIPALVFVVGGILALVVMVTGFLRADNVVDDFARIPAGETATIELSEAGGYRVFFEHESMVDQPAPSTTVTVEGPDGAVPVRPYATGLTYEMSGRSGRAIYTFDVAEPGDYEISVDSPVDGQFAIANENPLAMAARSLAYSFLIGGAATVVALILLLVLFGRRRRSKRLLAPTAPPYFPTDGPGVFGAPGSFGSPGAFGPQPGSFGPAPGSFGSPGAFGPQPGSVGPGPPSSFDQAQPGEPASGSTAGFEPGLAPPSAAGPPPVADPPAPVQQSPDEGLPLGSGVPMGPGVSIGPGVPMGPGVPLGPGVGLDKPPADPPSPGAP